MNLRYSAVLLALWLTVLSGIAPARAEQLGGSPGFVAGYIPPESAQYQPVYEAMRDAKIMEGIAEFLNAVFVLPRDVQLVMAEVGSVNAFYVPDHHAVIISYELVLHFIELFSKIDQENTAKFASGALLFVTFHELGHCLIAELNLPSTGREEDAVDEFATLLLIEFGDEGQLAIASAGIWFAATGLENDKNMPYWDEHSLSQQRFYSIFTLLYAVNPERYQASANDLGLPARRLEMAQTEYRKKDEAWSRLLQPHFRGQ